MPDFTPNDVTITLPSENRDVGGGGAFKNFSIATLSFGNGTTLTYATGGVPLPGIGAFGLTRAIDLFLIEQPASNGFIYKYDRATHKIKIFTQGVRTGATAAGAAESGARVLNSAGTEGAPRIPNTVANTTYDLGPAIELPNGVAPANVTMRVMVVGT